MTSTPKSSSEGRLHLPSASSFDADENLFAQVVVGWARRSGSMFEGRLLEAHVARLLGAHFPETAISSWDLQLDDGTRIQVRSATPGNAFKLGDGQHAGAAPTDVWVLVEKPSRETTEERARLRYFVLSRRQMDSIGKKTIAHSKLTEHYAPCGGAELADRVRQAALER
jgi:hypothetical protein